MHEVHLMKDLLEDLFRHAEKAEVKKITKLYVRMGEFTEINPDILTFFFKENTKGTIAEGAEVVIKTSGVRELVLESFDCE
ncbi:MAG TPA: hydrogenase/urease maturation nickel metallochaperone HypA [Candidatus Sumerlaeota bacterium]|nr:hydrogenase/urease maturation nickel metallochaperone HypA [Candidatus Sumerlaeota bacterium]